MLKLIVGLFVGALAAVVAVSLAIAANEDR